MWGTPYNSHDTLVTDHHDGLIETIDVLLYPHECAAVIERADEHGWKRSAPSGGGHGRTGREDPRTNYFSVFSDDALAAVLWSRVKPHLKEDLAHIPFNTYLSTETRGAEWRPVGVVEKMRIYRYEPGQQFPEHVDYKTGRNIVRGGKKYRQQSFLTLLVYLNADFQHGSGTTNYWPQHEGIHCRFLRDVEHKPAQLVIHPEVGRGVLQEQNILHEGSAPLGGVKYILRTDVIHEREKQTHPRLQHDAVIKDHVGEWERIFEASCKNYAE